MKHSILVGLSMALFGVQSHAMSISAAKGCTVQDEQKVEATKSSRELMTIAGTLTSNLYIQAVKDPSSKSGKIIDESRSCAEMEALLNKENDKYIARVQRIKNASNLDDWQMSAILMSPAKFESARPKITKILKDAGLENLAKTITKDDGQLIAMVMMSPLSELTSMMGGKSGGGLESMLSEYVSDEDLHSMNASQVEAILFARQKADVIQGLQDALKN